jgi:hypothetical protein
MTSPNLIRRLRYLYTTERNFVYVFSGLAIYTAIAYPIRSVVLLLYGLVLIAYLLFQGQRYWQVKLFRLLNQPIQEVAQLAFFHRAKRVTHWLFGLMPLVCLLQGLLLGWRITLTIRILLALLTNGFAVLEYINYYHWQLMIDTLADVHYLRRHHKLKIASLASDLAAQRL